MASFHHAGPVFALHRHIFHNEALSPVEPARLSLGQSGLTAPGVFLPRCALRAAKPSPTNVTGVKHAAIIRLPMPYALAKVRMHLTDLIHANKIMRGCARIYLINNHVGAYSAKEPLRGPPHVYCDSRNTLRVSSLLAISQVQVRCTALFSKCESRAGSILREVRGTHQEVHGGKVSSLVQAPT